MDAVHQEFDNSLSVSVWRVSREQEQKADTRDPSAPAWWVSDEEASDSFLASMGVVLD